MPNNFFSFKQFTIQQDRCAMKVCTDACILGAWTAEKNVRLQPVNKILDIGCGTGLLSLMLAQKTNAFIHAIEIDQNAFLQAKENIAQSPWPERITVFNVPLQEFDKIKKYELIICNPPFFEDDLKSPVEIKNAAKHDTTLRLEELVAHIKKLLTDKGSAFILLPFHRTEYFSSVVNQNDLFINESLFIKQTPAHAYFRSIIKISTVANQPIEFNELTIHDDERNYTAEFEKLLKDYYVKL